MRRLKTDREIMQCIYTMYKVTFGEFDKANPTRAAHNYVPIDIKKVAAKLDMNPHELFGRLYYDLDHRYRYKQDNGAIVSLFYLKLRDDVHCIHYAYLSAILADQQERYRKRLSTFWFALIALVLALGSIVVQAWIASAAETVAP